MHAGASRASPDEPVVTPIFQTSTFFTAAVPEGEVRYTRYGTNPNHERLAERLAAIEGAERALPLASGNAAMALALLACIGAGDHIVALRSLYGGTLRLLNRELPRLGVETTFVDIEDDFSAAVQSTTRALLIEMPVNPTLRIPDIEAIARVARAAGVPLIVDATFATPINFRPLEHGADLVVHSATKYLGGHSDVTAGVIAGRAELVAEARERLVSFGPVLDPHATWLLERGIKTLAVRMLRHNENGAAFAQHFASHAAVERVIYPGLSTHPDHERARRLFDGFGGMVSLVIGGGDDAALRMMQRLRLASAAPSLGGVETLVSMPRFTSHAALSAEQRRAIGIDDGFVRFSLGIEDAADLIADVEQALVAQS
ncbi:MAG: trans-sulfuration enzyme family protein [Longimicrobiales bacterium]